MPSLRKQRADERGTGWALGRDSSGPHEGGQACGVGRGCGAHGEAAVVDLGDEQRLLLLEGGSGNATTICIVSPPPNP